MTVIPGLVQNSDPRTEPMSVGGALCRVTVGLGETAREAGFPEGLMLVPF